jgi:hypothetical protein
VAKGPEDALASRELGGEDPAVAGERALQELLLEHHAERVSALDLRVEVDVPRVDVGEVDRELVLLARGLDRLEQAGVDPAGDGGGARLVAPGEEVGLQLRAPADHPQRAQLVDAVRRWSAPVDLQPDGTAGDGDPGES